DGRDKVVVVVEHEPQETDPKSVFNGTGNTRYANSYVKVLIAQKHGAVAVLAVPEPNRKHLSAAERMLKVPSSAERARRLMPQALAEGDARIPLLTVTDQVAAELLASTGKSPSQLQS